MNKNFCRKAQMVANGHKTETPASITYLSVVSHNSVRIALMIAALKDLKSQAQHFVRSWRRRCTTLDIDHCTHTLMYG